jgi:hypothetical protein
MLVYVIDARDVKLHYGFVVTKKQIAYVLHFLPRRTAARGAYGYVIPSEAVGRNDFQCHAAIRDQVPTVDPLAIHNPRMRIRLSMR